MKVDRIPLSVRLKRLKEGNASDPQYYLSSVRKWAAFPICDYMAAYPEAYEMLLGFLHLTKREAQTMTYQEIAVRVGKLFSMPETNCSKQDAGKAIRLLALPFECYYSIYIERT